ncbi:hypothetical protein I4U23_020693 [Adineta vaga]|nr:hypothetical protein I4U23_020693 [Adineta vaga]
MIILNNSSLSTTTIISIDSYLNSTIDTSDTQPSSSGIILTIIILSLLSISGWIFMSYTLFSRSEAYRTKPEDPFSSPTNSDRTDGHEFFISFD